MKKYLSIILSAVIAITCLIPFTAFAKENTEYDANFTQAEFESLEHVYAISIQPYSSGLITDYKLGIAKAVIICRLADIRKAVIKSLSVDLQKLLYKEELLKASLGQIIKH